MQSGVSHTLSISFHTHAHFDLDCMICFSMDLLFAFTTCEMQVCLVLYPTLSSTKSLSLVGKKKEAEIALVRNHTH